MIEQGTAGEIAQQVSYNFTPFEQVLTVSYVGNHADVEALVSTYQADGYSGTIQPYSGPKSIITGSKLVTGSLETRWGLDTQFEIAEARDSNSFNLYLDGLASDTLRATAIADITAAAAAFADGNGALHDALADSTMKAYCRDFALSKGYPQVTAVLRRTNIYPVDTAFVADWTDVGKVWTTAQINALTSAPSAIVGTLPSGRYWLMTPAGIEDDNSGRYIVNTHWIYGRWPSHSYTYK